MRVQQVDVIDIVIRFPFLLFTGRLFTMSF